jgi:MFS family permease
VHKPSLGVVLASVFIDLIGFGMIIPFLSFYAREYHANGTEVGALVGVYSLMQFFFSPVWGRLSDRFGRRPIILLGLAASFSGYLLFAFAHSYALLFISRTVAGIGGATIGTAQAYIADCTTPEERTKWLGMLGAAFGVGFIIGPALSGGLAAAGLHFGLPGHLLPGLGASALSLTAFLVALFLLVESKAPDAAVRSGIPPQFDPQVYRAISRNAVLFATIATLFLTLLAVAGMETSVTLHARDRFHFTQIDLAYFFLFMGLIVAMIQGGLIGRLAKRFGERTLVAIGAASFTFALVLIPSIWRVPWLYAVAFFIAIEQGLAYPSLTSLVTKATPKRDHGTMLGLSSGIGSLARFLGPIVTGFFYDVARARGAFYGQAIFVFLAFCIAMWMRRLPLLAEG